MVPPIIFKSCQQERTNLVVNFLKEQNADVIVLLESFMKNLDVTLNHELKTFYPYQSQPTKGGVMKANSGVRIFSKFPITSSDFILYQSKKSSDRFSKKGAVFAEISIENKKVQLIATHTQSLSKYRTAREKQFQELRTNLADKYYNANIPQVIAGDLNVNFYDTSAYLSMLKYLDVQPVNYEGLPYSWDGKNNQLANKYFEPIQETLDYILLRNTNNSQIKSSTIDVLHPYQSIGFCKKAFNDISDHYPIVTTIYY